MDTDGEERRERERRANEMEDRLIEFAVRVVKLTESLSRSPGQRHIASQLLRAGTSPAPNYAEARAAESRADFLHKLRIALKELNESCVWLRMPGRAQFLKPEWASKYPAIMTVLSITSKSGT